jgi:hypothetical protein
MISAINDDDIPGPHSYVSLVHKHFIVFLIETNFNKALTRFNIKCMNVLIVEKHQYLKIQKYEALT